MPSIPEFPKEGVKNHFFGLALAAGALVAVSMIYRPSYLPATFVVFSASLSMFLVNVFFVKVIHKSKVHDANRTVEFLLISVVAILGLLGAGVIGWTAEQTELRSAKSAPGQSVQDFIAERINR